jgi:hypothetical protein
MCLVFFCEAHHEIKMSAHSLHMYYNMPSTYMYITPKMRYGACWAQAIVPSEVRVKNLGEPKFLRGFRAWSARPNLGLTINHYGYTM